MELLKAAGDRLAAAKTMSFTAVATYESPSRLGPPLAYTVESQVTLQRPDKLRVISPADGPASEFYYDGKTMVAFAPAENLAAVADAPPTIDGALEAAYDTGAIYFPFADMIVADPYGDLADGLKLAFYIGQSQGGRRDHRRTWWRSSATRCSPRSGSGRRTSCRAGCARSIGDDPSRLRHDVVFSDWQLDGPVAADAFASAKAGGAKRIQFARPDPAPPPRRPRRRAAMTPILRNP